MTKVMKLAIEKAKRSIEKFCKKNGIELNSEILEVPVEEAREYISSRGYEDKWNMAHISLEEIYKDLNGDEAYVLPEEETSKKEIIIFDNRKIRNQDFIGKVQIMIHEFLHYADNHEIELGYANDDALEAEVEALSLAIALYPEENLEDGLDELSARYNPEAEHDEEKREFARLVKKSMFTMQFSSVVKRLEAAA